MGRLFTGLGVQDGKGDGPRFITLAGGALYPITERNAFFELDLLRQPPKLRYWRQGSVAGIPLRANDRR